MSYDPALDDDDDTSGDLGTDEDVSASMAEDSDDDETTFEDDHPSAPGDDGGAIAEGETDEDDDEGEVTMERDPPEIPGPEPTIRMVPLSKLYIEYQHWANPRSWTGLDSKEIADLAVSIKAGSTQSISTDQKSATVIAGIRVPLEVVMIRANGDEHTLVVDGQRRYLAVKHAKLPPDTLIPCIDLESEPVAWTLDLANQYLLRALEAVGTRAGLSSYEISKSAQQLRESRDPDTGKEYTMAKISRAIGRSESWVSKILSARGAASPKLLHRWKTGEITDEQFKELATLKGPAQAQAAEAVATARQQGDKAGARALAKESKIVAKERDTPVPKTAPGKAEPPARSKAEADHLPEVKPPPARKPPPFAVVEDMLSLAKKRPPTNEYVQGLMHGIQWASGLIDAGTFNKPWVTYMHHVQPESAPPKKQPPKPGKTADLDEERIRYKQLTGSRRKAAKSPGAKAAPMRRALAKEHSKARR